MCVGEGGGRGLGNYLHKIGAQLDPDSFSNFVIINIRPICI